ncbi:MAG: hypothetical protein R3B69_01620 [Candidatus Paceibacterota bacterium]
MVFSLQRLFGTQTETSRPTATVGIDFGSSSVKIVEIEDAEAALMLRTYGELQLGPYNAQELGQTVQLTAQQRTEAVVDVFTRVASHCQRRCLSYATLFQLLNSRSRHGC